MWYRTHRPRTLDDMAFADDGVERAVRHWIERREIPHLLLVGPPGTGKTTLARVLADTLAAPEDVLLVNASLETGIDDVRARIQAFVARAGIHGLRVAILDEADHLSRQAQASLRALMDGCAGWCRLILTGNWERRFIEPLRSRATVVRMEPLPADRLIRLGRRVLEAEGVTFDEADLAAHAERHAGDVRAFLGALEAASADGRLVPPTGASPSAHLELLGTALTGDFLAAVRAVNDMDDERLRAFYAFCAEALPRVLEGARLLKALVHLRDAVVDHEQSALPAVVCTGFLAAVRLILEEGDSPGRRRRARRP